ncbi:MAG TPA: SRPBCC family protein [Polyangia bacterium]|jgi:uncharacterized protein YndB with AHSA1/START domain|nr:SRPBCC family protein [Polyangia bacterium]
METSTQTDRIEKKILLRAPRARVWQSISNAREFGQWFGVNLEGTFRPKAVLRGKVTNPGYEHLTMEITVEEMQPEGKISWRWHPGAVDPAKDYSREPTTLVTFQLDDAPGGTLLTMVESGFDALPADRRAEAYRENDGGWTEQLQNIERHIRALS